MRWIAAYVFFEQCKFERIIGIDTFTLLHGCEYSRHNTSVLTKVLTSCRPCWHIFEGMNGYE